MHENEKKDGEPTSLRNEIRGFAGRVLADIKNSKLPEMPQAVSQCDYLLGARELYKEQIAYLLNDISSVFDKMGDDVPADYSTDCRKLVERVRGGEALDGEPVQVEVTAIAPEAPISAIPPQQTPITAPQPAEAIKDTPVIEMVDLAKIKTSELFEQLFSRRPEVVEQLAKDMLEHGFDPAHPLCLWGETLTDGNQRLTAAQKAGITRVPVVRHQFASELDAIEYAIAANSHRRDKLSESEKVHLVQVLDQRQPRGGDHKSAAAKSKAAPAAFEKSSQRTGRLIGISASQVERIRRVLDTGGEDIKAQVRNGTLTLSQAAAKVRARKKPLVLHEPTARRKAYTKASSTLTTVATNLRPFDAKLADRVDKLAVVMDGKAEAIGKKPEQIKPADKILELDSIGQIRKFKNAARISKLKNGVRVAAGNSDAQDQGSK